MAMTVVLGPILKFCGCADGKWTVSALVVWTGDTEPTLTAAVLPGAATGARPLAAVPQILRTRLHKRALHTVQRWLFEVEQHPTRELQVQYTVDGQIFTFTVPARDSAPTSAYTSCNGFSDYKKMKDIPQDPVWNRMRDNHAQRPYHLLLMGGDQVYSDAMWTTTALHDWAAAPNDKKLADKPVTKTLQAEIDDFFFGNYLKVWAYPHVALMLATIPTVMMWDDHDIIDGWGSYPEKFQQSPVFKAIFRIAREYFLLFQQHSASESDVAMRLPLQPGFSKAARFGDYGLLALDLRSERTPDVVMGDQSWQAAYTWLDAQNDCRHLLVMSSIPVVHPDFSTLEMLLCALPGQQELEDDLKDHWLSRTHQWERLRLIHRLQEWSQRTGGRVTILSGDVHVGAIGAIESRDKQHEGKPITIHQLTSSGVVHPPPPAMALFYLEHVGDKVEQLEGGITTSMYKFPGTSHRYIGARNYLSLEPDRVEDGRSRNRLWANWYVENEAQPYRQAILPLKD
jgi:hypothetical protein